MANNAIGSIKKSGNYWYVNYCLEQETFVESDESHLIETTEQYGFLTYNLTGSLKVNVNKVIADGNLDVEGLRLTEALNYLATQTDGDVEKVYSQLALIIDNDYELYNLCENLQAEK